VLTTAGCALALGLCGLLGSRADAATATQPLTVSATVGEALSLIIGAPTASAAAGDPSTRISATDALTLSIPAANEVTIPVTVQVRTSTQARVTLTVWAGSGMRNGTIRYAVANGSAHAPGTYTAALIYTLAAP
jgi:hypothetical protein